MLVQMVATLWKHWLDTVGLTAAIIALIWIDVIDYRSILNWGGGTIRARGSAGAAALDEPCRVQGCQKLIKSDSAIGGCRMILHICTE